MCGVIVLLSLVVIGADDEPVQLWSGNYGEVSLALLVRERPTVRIAASADKPGGINRGFTALWIEAWAAGADEPKCVWGQADGDTPFQAVVHLRDDGVLGIAYFRQHLGLWNYFVFETVDLPQKLSDPPMERPTTAVFPPRNYGAASVSSSYPIKIITSQIMGVGQEFRGHQMTLRRLTFADGKWKLTICSRGTAFEFQREDKGWAVAEGNHDECCDIPPQASNDEPRILRLPDPDDDPSDPIITYINKFNRGRGFGSGGGFGIFQGRQPKPDLPDEKR